MATLEKHAPLRCLCNGGTLTRFQPYDEKELDRRQKESGNVWVTGTDGTVWCLAFRPANPPELKPIGTRPMIPAAMPEHMQDYGPRKHAFAQRMSSHKHRRISTPELDHMVVNILEHFEQRGVSKPQAETATACGISTRALYRIRRRVQQQEAMSCTSMTDGGIPEGESNCGTSSKTTVDGNRNKKSTSKLKSKKKSTDGDFLYLLCDASQS